MPLFPIFLKLENRPCLVVGGGRIAAAKIEGLLAAGARVSVIAPETVAPVDDWIREGRIEWRQKQFAPSDLNGMILAIGATSDAAVNGAIFEEATRRGVLCNIVDDPERCDFHVPAVVRRGDLQIAISTGGHSPALAARIRRELEEQFDPLYAAWLSELGEARRRLISTPMDPDRRKALLHQLAGREAFQAFVSASCGINP